MELQTNPAEWIQLSPTIKRLSNRERIEWITALLETVDEEGVIDEIRTLVNDRRWNADLVERCKQFEAAVI